MQWLLLLPLVPYLYLLLKIYSGLQKIKKFDPGNISDQIFVSVIVSCRNEEENLPSLLADISEQDYDPDRFELIIVDDNSVDSTFRIASGYGRIRNLKVIKNSSSGKKSAIRSAMIASVGDLIVATDADCRLKRNWLKTISAFRSVYGPDLIIGPVMLKGGKGFLHSFQALEFLSLQGITAGTASAGNPVMCNGANLSFTRDTYDKHSGDLHFEKVSGDDIFLLHDAKKDKGKKILWLESEDVIVTTSTSSSWSHFFRQRGRWISKTGAYSDKFTVILVIVTTTAILIQPFLLFAGFFNPIFFLVLSAAFILKSIPDFLILRNTAARYGEGKLMRWFIPSQIFYTYYVLRIIPEAIFRGNRWDN
jgi:poly-beta-1,6-N-acetyl-D-glucosamine synthase